MDVERLDERPVAVGPQLGERGPGAGRRAALERDRVDAAGADLAPEAHERRAAGGVGDERVLEALERGLGLAVGIQQPGLPAGVLLAARAHGLDRLVLPLVLD